MNAKANRIKNLRVVLKEGFDGDLSALADAADTSYDNLWQILSGTKLPSGKPRGVGDDLAEKIERAADKPPGWLDQNHDLSDEAMLIAEMFSRMSPEDQKRLAPIIRAAIAPAISDRDVVQKMAGAASDSAATKDTIKR